MGTASTPPGTLNDFITTIKKFCKRLQLCNELYHIFQKMCIAEYPGWTNHRVELGQVFWEKGEMPLGSRDCQARAARQLDMRCPHRLCPGGLLAAPARLSIPYRLADRLRDESVGPVAPKTLASAKMAGCDSLIVHLCRQCRNHCVRGLNTTGQGAHPFRRIL